jgi:hypothetical protein
VANDRFQEMSSTPIVSASDRLRHIGAAQQEDFDCEFQRRLFDNLQKIELLLCLGSGTHSVQQVLV